MHKHDHCKHDKLSYCPICDTTYCMKCGKEWKYTYNSWHPYIWYTYTEPSYTIMSDNNSSVSHSHTMDND